MIVALSIYFMWLKTRIHITMQYCYVQKKYISDIRKQLKNVPYYQHSFLTRQVQQFIFFYSHNRKTITKVIYHTRLIFQCVPIANSAVNQRAN